MIILFGEARSADIFYRCGWNSDVDVIYTEEGDERALYVPGFEYLRAKREIEGVAVKKLGDPFELLEGFSGPFTIPTRFPYALAKKLSGDIETTREVFPERAVKDAEEVAAIARAQDAARTAIGVAQELLGSGTVEDGVLVIDGEPATAEGLKLSARSKLIEMGYDCPDLIISSGPQTGLPHHRGSGVIREGPVIIDIFPRSETTRYHGDMTRTVIVGEDEEAEKLLVAVRKAHEECVALCVPGAKASEVHEHAQEILSEHGFETDDESGFIHSLGHGVGLDIHEEPSLSPKSETVLEEGMVVTVEPGLYYDIGVRWEDIVVVGDKPRVV